MSFDNKVSQRRHADTGMLKLNPRGTQELKLPNAAEDKPKPKQLGDRANTGPLTQPREPERSVDVEAMDFSEIPDAPPPKKPGTGFLNGLKSMVSGAGDLAAKGVDLVGDAANVVVETHLNQLAIVAKVVGAEDAAKSLQDTGNQWGDGVNGFVDGLGEQLVSQGVVLANGAIDMAGLVQEHGWEGAGQVVADGLWGPVIPGQEGEFPGLLGEVTSRLSPGEGTYLQLGGSVGVGAVLGVEGALDGALSVARGPDGALYVSMSVQGEVEGSASVETGAEVEVAGMGAGATAEAGAAIRGGGAAKITMRFDPKKPADRARLEALLRPSGPTPLAVLNPTAMAAPTVASIQEALKHNFHRLESSGSIEGGLSASAGAEAPGVALEAGAEAKAGGSVVKTYLADGRRETTVVRQAEASAYASAEMTGVGALEKDGAVGGVEAFTVGEQADGALTSMRMRSTTPPPGYAEEEGGTTESGTELTVGDPEGEEGGEVTMGLRQRVVSTFTTQLTPEGLQAAQKLMAEGKSARQAFTQMASQAGMSTTEATESEVREGTLGVNLEGKVAGTGGRLRLEATIGTYQMAKGQAVAELSTDLLHRTVGG